MTPNLREAVAFLIIAENADVRVWSWRGLHCAKLDARKSLQNEIGCAIGIRHTGTDNSEAADRCDGDVIVDMRDGEHSVSRKRRAGHLAVALLEDVEWQERAGKKSYPRKDHDIRVICKIVYVILIHWKTLRALVLSGCKKLKNTRVSFLQKANTVEDAALGSVSDEPLGRLVERFIA